MPLMSDEDVSEFIASEPSAERISNLSVAELRLVASELGLANSYVLPKVELVTFVDRKLNLPEGQSANVTYDHPVTSDNRDDRVNDNAIDPDNTSPAERALLLQIQLENAKLKTLEKQVELAALNSDRSNANFVPQEPRFDLSSALKLVPRFSVENVDEFFVAFERIANQMQWPREFWTALLQHVLTGRAQRVYASLSEDESGNYETVKDEVLRSYELVPEAYRKRFRGCFKKADQTHLEFVSWKRDRLSKWLRSTSTTSFDSLFDLVLLEEFMNKIDKDVYVYLIDKGCVNAEEAARLADNFAVNHNIGRREHSDGRRAHSKFNSKHHEGTRHTHTPSVQPSRQAGPPNTSASTFDSKRLRPLNSSFVPNRSVQKPRRVCSFCGKLGHTAEFCWQLNPKADPSKSRPIMCACGTSVNDVRAGTGSSVADQLAESSHPRTPEVDASVNAKPLVLSFLARADNSPDVCLKRKEDPNMDGYNAFISEGTVVHDGTVSPIVVLRDTGSLQTLLRANVINVDETPTSKFVVLTSIYGTGSAPLYNVDLDTADFCGKASVAILPQLPIPGVDCILGNDLAGGSVKCNVPLPVVQESPLESDTLNQLERDCPDVFPLCAVTRSMSRRVSASHNNESPVEIAERRERRAAINPTFSFQNFEPLPGVKTGKDALVEAQRSDETLQPLFEEVEANSNALPDSATHFYIESDVLFRCWIPPKCRKEDESWAAVRQLVVPVHYRLTLLQLAHDHHLSGHFGIRRTFSKLIQIYYWPKMRSDVAHYVRTCEQCQKVGKANKPPQPAPLVSVPIVSAPFSVIQMDIVGPLPRTKRGHEYILTLYCVATRFSHAVPLRKVTAKAIIEAVLNFFSLFGLPSIVQTDGASYFVGKAFGEAMHRWNIQHRVSSPYHPATQGGVERSHQTMKASLRKYGLANQGCWDDDLPYVLAAMRDSINDATGFSANELVFAHQVRTILHVMRDRLLGNDVEEVSLIELAGDLKDKVIRYRLLAEQSSRVSKQRAKTWFDTRARLREFAPGDLVLMLLPVRGNPLQAKFSGPYKILKKLSNTNYIVSTPDRRRPEKLCHVNMLKRYYERDGTPVAVVRPSVQPLTEEVSDVAEPLYLSSVQDWSENSKVLSNKLQHLEEPRRSELLQQILQYPEVFSNQPGRTNLAVHDIDVGEAKPIKSPPYRVHPSLKKQVQEELEKMLAQDIIEPAVSEWCSPVTLVRKADNTIRFCVDYRKVNAVTRKDAFPLPRIEDCIEAIGNSKYVSKIDCLKGFWQIPLTPRARDVSCFATLGRTYTFKVMPPGFVGVSATFQKLMSDLTSGLDNCVAYLDDIVVYSDTWPEHLAQLEALFLALARARLVINLGKSEFCCARLQYLGHEIGLGTLAPSMSKCMAIKDMAPPTNKRQVRRFLGTVGYYRRYVCNFASLALPLTDLLRKNVKFHWSNDCELAFQSLKDVLISHPVLRAPDFGKPFKLACDASNLAAGSVLLQADDQGIDHPVAYHSVKFNPSQVNYSTIEKELLAIILSLLHFDYYLSPQPQIVVYCDHKPLQFINNFHSKNQRLVRWQLFLQGYNLKIQHVKGRDNFLPDLLSRPN